MKKCKCGHTKKHHFTEPDSGCGVVDCKCWGYDIRHTEKIKYSVEFIIKFQTKDMIALSNIILGFDLGIDKIAATERMTWKTPTNVNKKYMLKAEEAIRKAFEIVNCKVIEVTSSFKKI